MLASRSVVFLPLTLILLASVACDESDPAGEGGAGGGQSDGGAPLGGSGSGNEEADQFCEELVARDVECAVEQPTTKGECLADELTVCLYGGIRDGVREAIVECVLARPCDAEGDLETCIYGPGEAAPVAGQVEFRTACLDLQASCGTFSDDHCIINFFDTPAYELLSACLEETCDLVGSCIDDTASELCAG